MELKYFDVRECAINGHNSSDVVIEEVQNHLEFGTYANNVKVVYNRETGRTTIFINTPDAYMQETVLGSCSDIYGEIIYASGEVSGS